MLSPLVEGELHDIDRMAEEEIIKIERRHATVPRKRVNIKPGKRGVILCLEPDSDLAF